MKYLTAFNWAMLRILARLCHVSCGLSFFWDDQNICMLTAFEMKDLCALAAAYAELLFCGSRYLFIK